MSVANRISSIRTTGSDSGPSASPHGRVPTPLRITVVPSTRTVGSPSGSNLEVIALDQPDAPLTPSTPVLLTFGDWTRIKHHVMDLRNESSGLREMVSELNIRVEESRALQRGVPGSGMVPPTPSRTAVVLHGSEHRAASKTPVRRGSLLDIAITPTSVGNLDTNVNGTDSDAPPSRRRAGTPTRILQHTNGRPVMAKGLERQPDRGLLLDFFGDLKKWALQWCRDGPIDAVEVGDLVLPGTYVHDLLGNFSSTEGADLIQDNQMRIELLTAIVTKVVSMYTFSEHFLALSDWFESPDAETIIERFDELGLNSDGRKHGVLEWQKDIYTLIKHLPDHRRVRSETSKRLANDLITNLAGLLQASTALAEFNRGEDLRTLFIKGYRIGFRMRMEPAKWRIEWPVPGQDFDLETMVNNSHYLYGDTATTLQRTMQAPGNHTVRFALSPTISKSFFNTGSENREIVHKAMTFLTRKDTAIGAERRYLTKSACE